MTYIDWDTMGGSIIKFYRMSLVVEILDIGVLVRHHLFLHSKSCKLETKDVNELLEKML